MKEVQPPEVSTLVTFVAEAFGKANRSTLEAHFSVGDKIGAYLALSGRPVQPTVKLIASECAEKVSWVTLRTAVTFANRINKPAEREAILSTGCTVNAAIALSLMEPSERTATIRDCKSGKRKWRDVMSNGQRRDRERQKANTLKRATSKPRADLGVEVDTELRDVIEIRLSEDGDRSEVVQSYGLACYISRVGIEVAERVWKRAMQTVSKRDNRPVTDRDRARIGRQWEAA